MLLVAGSCCRWRSLWDAPESFKDHSNCLKTSRTDRRYSKPYVKKSRPFAPFEAYSGVRLWFWVPLSHNVLGTVSYVHPDVLDLKTFIRLGVSVMNFHRRNNEYELYLPGEDKVITGRVDDPQERSPGITP